MSQMTQCVLADDSPNWRPSGFADNLLGCSIDFRFPTVKLLDFVGKEAELEANPNPFAVVILAFLNGRATADDDKRRSLSKIHLIRSLYERGLGRDDVRKLFRLINWFMVLPKAMENEVWHEIEKIEQEKQMQHLTTIEQIWLEEGEARGRAKLEAAIELALRLKFGPASATALMPQVHALTSAQLDDLMPLIETTPSADELLQRLPPQH